MKQSADKQTATTTSGQELSYYKVKLINFMASMHPRFIEKQKVTKDGWEEWLSKRVNAAEVEDEKRTLEGMAQNTAEEYATDILLAGLRFSPSLMVQKIITDNYPELSKMFSAELINSVEDSCAEIFDKYALGDDWETDPICKTCRTELQLHIHQFLYKNYK